MASSATLDALDATVRAVCSPYPQISTSTVDVISEIIKTPTLTDDQIRRIREIIQNRNATAEPPMEIAEACHLLGDISKAALHYHIRKGHIRRCSIPGAARGRGVVAADVRKIVNGEAA